MITENDLTILGKYGIERIKTADKEYFFCGTSLAYEDIFWRAAEEALKIFGYDVDDACDSGVTPEIRDRFIQAFKDVMNIEIIDVCKEY